jgi:hypothetical protein
MVTGTCTGDPSCSSGSSPRAAAPAGERPAHDRGDLRHDQRLRLEDMTGPRARRVASRGCAPAQARRTGPLPRRSRSASRPRAPDCFSGLRRTRLLSPLAAGCEPRAGLREMPSRKLRDSAAAGGGSDGHGDVGGHKAERGSPKPGRFGPGTHPVPRRPAGQHPGQPRSPGPPAMVTVRGTAADQSPARRPGLLSRLLSRSLAVCADHATCVTPAHPVRQEAREGAQRESTTRLHQEEP